MSSERCVLLSSALVCISALLPLLWKLMCSEIFSGCGALLWQLLTFLFNTSVCVAALLLWVSKGAGGLGTMRSLALFGCADLNSLVCVTGLWLSFLWKFLLHLCASLALEEAGVKTGVEKWSGCCLTTVMPWWLGGGVESMAFMVTYTSTKCICFWRISTKFFWHEARETSWPFNRCRRVLATHLHGRESDNAAVT